MASFQYNQANDQTYQSILAGYKAQQQNFGQQAGAINSGYNQMISDNQGYGASQKLALQQQYDRNTANTQQSMISRGLGNTGVLDSAQRGNNYDFANSQLTLQDQLLQRQQGLQQSQLGYQAQAQQQGAALQGQALDYQGQALGQRYGAEANYVSQYDLGNQAAYNSQRSARLGYDINTNLQQQQNNYDLQKMRLQNQNQDYQSRTYGYY